MTSGRRWWAVLGLVVAVGLQPQMVTAQEGAFAVSDGPIEITADELEVQQAQGIATFRGDVDAVQGELRLTADELTVHYGGAAGEGGDIERVEARGDVVVRSVDDVATGDVGTYDLMTRQITLTGDVVLTSGGNVLRGRRLDVDLATGLATMRAGDGRVRGLFQSDAGSG